MKFYQKNYDVTKFSNVMLLYTLYNVSSSQLHQMIKSPIISKKGTFLDQAIEANKVALIPNSLTLSQSYKPQTWTVH